jgi:hypothetical protein
LLLDLIGVSMHDLILPEQHFSTSWSRHHCIRLKKGYPPVTHRRGPYVCFLWDTNIV